MGTTFDISTDDGVAEAYLTGSGPGVLLFIDAIGLRPRIEEIADRIAGWGYTVLAPNVFYRMGTAAELRPTLDLTVPENRRDYAPVIAPRVQGYTPKKSDPDTERWLDVLAEHASGEKVGVTGYCMGPVSPSGRRHYAPGTWRPSEGSTARPWSMTPRTVPTCCCPGAGPSSRSATPTPTPPTTPGRSSTWAGPSTTRG